MPEPIVSVRPELELPSHDAGMDTQDRREGDQIAVREERSLAGNEGGHLCRRDGKILRRLVRFPFFLWDVSAGSGALAFQFRIEDHGQKAVSPPDVLKFMDQHEPEIIDAVMPDGQAYNRRSVV